VGRSEALRLYTAVNDFPGHDNEWLILERLGEAPDLETLRKAVSFWRANGNKMGNHMGICDWYAELKRDPNWTPGGRFKSRASPVPNGNGHEQQRKLSRSEQVLQDYAQEKARILGIQIDT
jgi:hypothetical protein